MNTSQAVLVVVLVVSVVGMALCLTFLIWEGLRARRSRQVLARVCGRDGDARADLLTEAGDRMFNETSSS